MSSSNKIPVPVLGFVQCAKCTLTKIPSEIDAIFETNGVTLEATLSNKNNHITSLRIVVCSRQHPSRFLHEFVQFAQE